MDITVTLKVRIGDHLVELTREEAQRLRDNLTADLGRPEPYPVYVPYPVVPQAPYITYGKPLLPCDARGNDAVLTSIWRQS